MRNPIEAPAKLGNTEPPEFPTRSDVPTLPILALPSNTRLVGKTSLALQTYRSTHSLEPPATSYSPHGLVTP